MARPAPSLNEVIRLVARLSMPSTAISVLARNPGPEALALMRARVLSTPARRRLTELAFRRLADPGDDAELLAFVLAATLPDAPPVGLPRRFTAAGEDDLVRQLFRTRPDVDLREVSPHLYRVPDHARFVDTFTHTMKTLFDHAGRDLPKVVRNLDHWTAWVETILGRDFGTASPAVKIFVAQALDRRFLNAPAPPAEVGVLAEVRTALAARAAPIPGRGVIERVVDTPLREYATPGPPDPAPDTATPRDPLREVVIHPSGAREVAELPDHLRRKLDEFLEVARDPSRHVEMVTARGRWNIEALVQFGPAAYGARLTRGYRVLFDLEPGRVLVRRVNKGQIHGN